MGLFDSLKGKLDAVTGAAELAEHAPALKDAVLELLAHKDFGGLSGLVEKFKSQGLGDVISSWTSTGSNLPINAEQITQTLGPKAVQFLSEKSGVAPEKVAAGLTYVLPMIVDKLTPNGQVPEDSVLSQGLAALKNFKFNA
jgi:uncharacterized protein YidB (DUF937 family)